MCVHVRKMYVLAHLHERVDCVYYFSVPGKERADVCLVSFKTPKLSLLPLPLFALAKPVSPVHANRAIIILLTFLLLNWLITSCSLSCCVPDLC